MTDGRAVEEDAPRAVSPMRALRHGQFFGEAGLRADGNGFAIALMRPDPVNDIALHTHETAHFILHLEGVYLTSAAGSAGRALGPTLVFNPPGTTHRDRYERANGVFSGRFLSIGVNQDVMRAVDISGMQGGDARCLFSPVSLGAAARLLRECRHWNAGSPTVVEGLSLELLGAAHAPNRRELDDGAAWIRRAHELLRDRCADAVTVRQVAEACGVHPVHLARVFRRRTGISPGMYLRRCRLERAAALLVEGREPLSVVALNSGFADQSHLTKAFGRAYALTPGEYRGLLSGAHAISERKLRGYNTGIGAPK